MDTTKGLRPMGSFTDVHMATTKGFTFADDITMDTVRGGATLKQGGLQVEKRLLESSEVRRKATVAQLCKCSLRLLLYLYHRGPSYRLPRLLLPELGIPGLS